VCYTLQWLELHFKRSVFPLISTILKISIFTLQNNGLENYQQNCQQLMIFKKLKISQNRDKYLHIISF